MAIGVLSLTVGILFSVCGILGNRNEEKPVRKAPVVSYPYPREIL